MSTLNFSTDLHNLPSVIERLPADVQRQVIEYVEFLVEKYVSSDKQDSEENWFWELIDLLDFDQSNNDKILQPLIATLARKEDSDIFLFDDILSELLKRLDAPKFYEVAKTGTAGSADMFLYARCEVVANGKDFFHQVLEAPEDFLANGDLEELLSAAAIAYEKKNGKPYDYTPKNNYETMWNGEAWGEKAISFGK